MIVTQDNQDKDSFRAAVVMGKISTRPVATGGHSQDDLASGDDTMIIKTNHTRRKFIKSGSVILAAPAILRATTVGAQGAPFKIGIVSPQTGPLAGFGEAEDYILNGLTDTIAGITNNGAPVAIKIIRKGSQSNPNRAAEVAQELILNDGVNLALLPKSS